MSTIIHPWRMAWVLKNRAWTWMAVRGNLAGGEFVKRNNGGTP